MNSAGKQNNHASAKQDNIFFSDVPNKKPEYVLTLGWYNDSLTLISDQILYVLLFV
jgi:hypothetical protein